MATVSLLTQLVIIALVLIGFQLKQHLKFRSHGLVMSIVFLSHLVAIGGIMIPSFTVGLLPMISAAPASITWLFVIVHAIAGTITAILGLWIVAAWRFRQSLDYCLPKKRIMLTMFILWLTSLSLGIIFYVIFYWSLLFG